MFSHYDNVSLEEKEESFQAFEHQQQWSMRVVASCCELFFLLLHEGTEPFQKTDNEERTLCANLETSATKLSLYTN